jgi:hypothetical protein
MPDEHVDRVLRQGDLWPMAEGPHAMDDLKAILESRSALYAEAGATVSTSRRTPRAAGQRRRPSPSSLQLLPANTQRWTPRPRLPSVNRCRPSTHRHPIEAPIPDGLAYVEKCEIRHRRRSRLPTTPGPQNYSTGSRSPLALSVVVSNGHFD